MSSLQPEADQFGALLARARDGDNDAVNEVMSAYGHHILTVIRHRLNRQLRSLFDSIDFTQQVWLHFFTRALHQRTFETDRKLIRYLARMAERKVLQAQRQQMETAKRDRRRQCAIDSPAVVPERDLVDPRPTPEQAAAVDDRWVRLLQGLPPEVRQALTMLRNGASRREAADMLGVTERWIERSFRRLQRRCQAAAADRIEAEGQPC